MSAERLTVPPEGVWPPMVPICASAWAIWSEAAVSCAEPAESSLMPLPYWEAPLESWLAPLESWLAPLESWAMASTS